MKVTLEGIKEESSSMRETVRYTHAHTHIVTMNKEMVRYV